MNVHCTLYIVHSTEYIVHSILKDESLANSPALNRDLDRPCEESQRERCNRKHAIVYSKPDGASQRGQFTVLIHGKRRCNSLVLCMYTRHGVGSNKYVGM